MTRCAFGVEEGFSRFRVADQNTDRFLTRLVITADAEAMDECGDIGNLGRSQRQSRHFVADAVLHDRRNQLAVLVVQHGLRTDEAGASRSAARIRAMTERAVRTVERLAAFDGGRIGRGMLRKGVGESASTRRWCLASTAAAPLCRRSSRSRRLGL